MIRGGKGRNRGRGRGDMGNDDDNNGDMDIGVRTLHLSIHQLQVSAYLERKKMMQVGLRECVYLYLGRRWR